MKKIASLLLTAAMVVAMTGCAGLPSGSNASESGNSGSSSSGSGSSALGDLIGNSTTDNGGSSTDNGSTTGNGGITAQNGYAEGRIGDVMQTAWFTFTVNSAYVTGEYEGYAPAEGNELLVVDITVKNTFNASTPMFDTDFQAQWNDTADDAYAWPVEAAYSLSSDILPDQYELAINESRNGLLLYEVPANNKDFSISFLEWYEDDTEGDVFFVYFTAEDRR